jgi:hypothetical protein
VVQSEGRHAKMGPVIGYLAYHRCSGAIRVSKEWLS